MLLRETVIVKKVETKNELLKAAEIVYDRYLSAGYIKPNKFNLWITHFQLLPESEILIALNKEGKILATVSFIDGNRRKVPADVIFGKQIKSFRKKGIKFCELMSLANIGIFDVFAYLMLKLFEELSNRFDLVVIEVNPRREFVFRRFGFELVDQSSDHYLVDAPALLMTSNPKETLNKIKEFLKW